MNFFNNLKKSRDSIKKTREILFGFNSVYEALRAGRRTFERIFISQIKSRGQRDKIESLIHNKGINVEMCDTDLLERLTKDRMHQGIAARVSSFPVENENVLFRETLGDKRQGFVLALDNIEDPHNLGALIRTAECAGVDYISIPRHRSAAPTPTVSRISAGAMEHSRILMTTNTVNLLKRLKENGFWIAGLDAAGETSIYKAGLTGHIVLVVGGEHRGIRMGVQKECDFLLSIPMAGMVNSLNASVAGAIGMFEIIRQREGNDNERSYATKRTFGLDL